MPDNVSIIRGMYKSFAKGDVPAVVEAMDSHIEWIQAENFPYADRNPYIGPPAVVEGVFTRLATEWEGFAVDLGEVHGAGDVVVAEGRYKGKYKKTGRQLDAQFAHVWRLRNGRVVGYQQYTDTEQAARVVRGH